MQFPPAQPGVSHGTARFQSDAESCEAMSLE